MNFERNVKANINAAAANDHTRTTRVFKCGILLFHI